MNVTAGNSKVHRAGPRNVFDQYTAKCGKVAPHRLWDTDAEANCNACHKVEAAEQNVPDAKRAELIAAVRAHASENYDQGWDVIVECYDDEQIADVIGRARTAKGALAKFAAIIDVVSDRRAEAAHQAHAAIGNDEPAVPAGGSDGSVVSCCYTHDGELTSAIRTWPGKVGQVVINVYNYDDSEPAEYYVPGWRGQIIDTPGYCGHRGRKSPGCWDCGDSSCNTKAHPECEPPF